MANLRTRFPAAIDAVGANGNLPGLADRLSFFLPIGKLLNSVTASATRLTIANIDIGRVPVQGIVRIDDEIIAYTRLEGSDLVLASPAEGRGLAGTIPVPHIEMADVMWLITSQHFEVVYSALQAMQTRIGTQNSADQSSLDWQMREQIRLQAGADNGYLCDTFTLTEGNVINRYVELRQAVKTGTDIMVFVEGGPSIHPDRGVYVEENDNFRVKWSADSVLAANLAVGDTISVTYRAKAPD